jgi:transglutaminase-like putative cysteine protease
MKPRTGWSSIVLVGIMMLTVAWSIRASQPAPGLEILGPVVLGGVLFGAILGLRAWLPAGLAHGWSMVLGLFVTVFATAGSLSSYPSAPVEALSELSRLERMGLVRDWYLRWIALQRGRLGPSIDPNLLPADQSDLAFLFFAVTMALLMWLLAYICTWFVVRYLSWWGAVLPSGFALVFNLSNSRLQDNFSIYLAFFLICALILASQTFLALQTERWRKENVGYSPDLGFDVLRDGLILTVAIVAATWMLPTDIDRGSLQRAAQRLTREPQSRISRQIHRWFPSIEYPTRGGGNAFGTEMGLSGSISLGSEPVFDVTVDEDAPVPRYWRQAVFDRYDGAGWKRSVDERRQGEAGQDWSEPAAASVPVTQSYKTYHSSTKQLYAAPQALRFDLPTSAESAADGADLLSFESLTALPVGSEYRVISGASVVDVESLRNAQSADPDWVEDRYLQLPASVSERTRALAGSLAAGQANRYDKSLAIERELRTIPYSEDIDRPPEDQDRVDWFLFDERRGYCDYYSSSFVVMARSVGIPARIAAGYSRGQLQGDGQTWRQRASEAHTWPEVYFPGYGWIEFEPTAADAPIARPNSADDAETLAEGPQSGSLPEDMLPEEERDALDRDEPPASAPAGSGSADGGSPLPRLPLMPLLILLGSIGMAFGLGHWLWQRPLAGLSPAEGAFARLIRVAGWFGLGPGKADTPHEYGQRVAAVIPEGTAEISTIVDGYVSERFGRRSSSDESDRLAQSWLLLRRAWISASGRLGLRKLRRKG